MTGTSHQAPALLHGWIPGLLVAGVALATFSTALTGEFVLDDVAFLPDNPRLDAVRDPLIFFTSRVWDFARIDVEAPLHRPVFLLVLWLGHRTLGGHPAAWHALSLCLHAASAVLVWRLLRRLLPAAPPFAPLAGAVLFAVHPVHTEAVAWILGLVHPLATLLAVGAALAQARHVETNRSFGLAAAAVLSAAAMLASEGALVLPPLLVLLDWTLTSRFRPAVALAHAAPPILVLALRSHVLAEAVPLRLTPDGLGTAAGFLAAYVQQLLIGWPQDLYLSLPSRGIAGPLAWTLTAAVVALTTVLLWRLPAASRAVPLLALAWLWAGLLPPSVAGMNPRPLFAPRALYLPSVGLVMLAAWMFSRWALRAPAASLAAAVALGAVGAGASASFAVGWRDNATIYARASASDPANTNLGLKRAEVLAARGDAAGAEAVYREAAARAVSKASRLDALEALAAHLGTGNRVSEAEEVLRDVLREAPERSSAWVGMGNVAFYLGEVATARDRYLKAFELDPRNVEAATNLSLAYRTLGDPGEAARWAGIARTLAVGP